MKRKFIISALVLAFLITITACTNTSKSSEKAGESLTKEQQAVSTGFQRLTNSQQVPSFDWSQERQTLIDVESIRASGALSTTQFYLPGIGMVEWCPSKGAPMPSTYELSAKQQWVNLPDDHSDTLFSVDQGEPTGVYPGDSQATWVLCLDDNGKAFAVYWEGPVGSTVGVVNGLPDDKRVRVDQATFQFTEKPR